MTHLRIHTLPNGRPLKNFVNELLNDLPASFRNGQDFLTFSNARVNIHELPGSYRLELVAPGFEKTDFKIDLEDNLLTIAGSHKVQEAGKDKTRDSKVIRKEFEVQDFKRSFTIDEKIDATAITASYVNGVLILNLPMKPEVKEEAKKIVIN